MEKLTNQQIIDKHNNEWDFISKYERLSESFIREFQDKVDWYYIIGYQTHINYDRLIQSLPKPSKGSLISYKKKGHGIVLNINKNKYKVFFINSRRIKMIKNEYSVLNMKVIQ